MAKSDSDSTEKSGPFDVARKESLPQHNVSTAQSRLPLQQRIRLALTAAYQSTVVELILRRKHLVASNDGRHIPLAIEREHPLVDIRRGHSYISNNVRTSRYTVWDFIPKQLFFQFSRVGNFYFLCVGIPQMVSPRSQHDSANACR